MNGGYFLFDGGGLDLTTGSTPVTITGAYKRAKDAFKSGKPIVAGNLKYGNAPVTPVNCFGWELSATEIVLVSATIHVHIKNDDSVTTIDVAPSTSKFKK